MSVPVAAQNVGLRVQTPVVYAPSMLDRRRDSRHGRAAKRRMVTGFSIGCVALFSLTACSDSEPEPTATFNVRASVEQLHITNTQPGTTLEVVDADDIVVDSGATDEQGSLIFRLLAPGSDYTVRTVDGTEWVDGLTVMSVDNSLPDQDFYSSQVLQPGFNYIMTRDGTLLSAYVQMPGPPEEGPYPTLINYSGYSPSKPGAPIEGTEGFCNLYPVLCDAPDHPSGIIGGVLGFATVGVNMRGTGCSGGAYDFFEPLQLLDGYDIIETVAAQPWVKHNKVGMAGLSYPGLSQIYVAATQPPSLAAITPLSVISDVQSTMVPGGILNDGFAINWATRVLDNAGPFGQAWSQDRVDMGDTVCEENQLLHSQKIDITQKAYDNPYYDPVVADPLNLNLQAPKINVPVFLASAFQDEQTGPGFASLLDKFSQSPQARFQIYNGVHIDGYAPQLLVEWYIFLSLYLKQEVPQISNTLYAFAPELFREFFYAALSLPDNRFADYTDYETALSDYEAEPAIRVYMENGTGDEPNLGGPVGGWDAYYTEWPPQETVAMRWYMQPDGTLGNEPPTEGMPSSKFTLDPDEGQKLAIAPGGNIWALLPEFDWTPHEDGRAVVFESSALDNDLVTLGHASVDLWVRSTADDADLEVTLSEIRPDGNEMYIQSGWLRTSLRALADDATELRPTKTWREEDLAPLTPGEWVEARVEVFAFAHVFRAGSKIRVSVDTPGNSRAEWRFNLKTFTEDVDISIGHSATYPSSLVLPVIPGAEIPNPMPPCPSLRGQMCRPYTAFENAVEQN